MQARRFLRSAQFLGTDCALQPGTAPGTQLWGIVRVVQIENIRYLQSSPFYDFMALTHPGEYIWAKSQKVPRFTVKTLPKDTHLKGGRFSCLGIFVFFCIFVFFLLILHISLLFLDILKPRVADQRGDRRIYLSKLLFCEFI